MCAWLPGHCCSRVSSFPLFEGPTRQRFGDPRPLQKAFANVAECPAVCHSSIQPEDWTGLRIGPASTTRRDLFYWDCVTSSYASEMIIKDTPTRTIGTSLVWPHEINCSLPTYTDGRKQFWKGCPTQSSDEISFIDKELRVQSDFLSFVLHPVNVAVCGNVRVGWGPTGAAESLVPLGGLPDLMCAPASAPGVVSWSPPL